MSAIAVQIDFSDLASADLRAIGEELSKPAVLHAAIAGAAENWIKETGSVIAAGQHASATRLGAEPTGHLAKAYEQIESQSDDSGASLLVPRASRLAAAFGPVIVKPGAGKYYLTIAVAEDSYGKRAGEFDDLFFARVGPKHQPVLAQKTTGRGTQDLDVKYILVTEANIPEDPSLIPFEELGEISGIAAEEYLDALITSGNGGPA